MPDNPEQPDSDGPVIFTIGHSTQALEAFLKLLQVHAIKLLVDVRTIPRSRHNPQFNLESLSSFLPDHRIHYLHLKVLGGLRHARKDSPNTGWQNAAFRGFADYMQTPEFAEGLQQLINHAENLPTAIMCAEAVPWRCHRSLIADALTVRGIQVRHILGETRIKIHTLTAMAKVDGLQILYPSVYDTVPETQPGPSNAHEKEKEHPSLYRRGSAH